MILKDSTGGGTPLGPAMGLRRVPLVVFALREPADRAYSDYRYLLHQYAP